MARTFAPMSDCCVCGEWFVRDRLNPIHKENLNPKCIRFLNTTLDEKYVCRRCSVRCPTCGKSVTRVHCDLQNGMQNCWVCMGRDSAKNKNKTF